MFGSVQPDRGRDCWKCIAVNFHFGNGLWLIVFLPLLSFMIIHHVYLYSWAHHNYWFNMLLVNAIDRDMIRGWGERTAPLPWTSTYHLSWSRHHLKNCVLKDNYRWHPNQVVGPRYLSKSRNWPQAFTKFCTYWSLENKTIQSEKSFR